MVITFINVLDQTIFKAILRKTRR